MKLAVALFAVGVACLAPENMENVKRLLAEIQSQMEKIDYTSPPYSDTQQIEEKTCFSWLYDCSRVNFKIRQQLVDKKLSLDSNHLVDSTPNVTVYHRSVVEQDLENSWEEPLHMSLDVSHASSDSTTKGWHIDAHFSATASAGGGTAGASGGWGINGGYSESRTGSTSDSKSLSVSGLCKPRYNCRIETWTFHVKISGSCELRPSINCGREMDPCASDWEEACSQFESYRTRKCILTDGAASRYPRVDCELVAPIKRDSGELFSKVMLIMDRNDATQRLSNGNAERLSTGNAKTPAVAVDYSYGLYLLNTNEWYDADKKEKPYFSVDDGDYYDKPGEPKPDITEVASRPTCVIEKQQGSDLYRLNTCEWYNATAKTNPYYADFKEFYSKPLSPKPDLDVDCSKSGQNKCPPYNQTGTDELRKLRRRWEERPETKDKIVSTAEHLAKRWEERPEMVVEILA